LHIHASVFSADRPANPAAGFAKDGARVAPSHPSPIGWERVGPGEGFNLGRVEGGCETKIAGKVSLFLQMRELLEEDFQEALS
jgi:hypothetical protein